MGKTLGSNDSYSEKESAERFKAALKGARIAGHKPMVKKAASPKARRRKAKK
jgi:hypothetical protein